MTQSLESIRQLVRTGDYVSAEKLAKAFLEEQHPSPEDQVTALLLWAYSADMNELNGRRNAAHGYPSASELAVRAVKVARSRLSATHGQRAGAEYRAGMYLHSVGRNEEAWEHVSLAYEYWASRGRVETMLVSLYAEVSLACGKANLAVAPAKAMVEYENTRGVRTTLIMAVWLYGRCLAAVGDIAEARAQLEIAFDLAVKERSHPELLAELQAIIDECSSKG